MVRPALIPNRLYKTRMLLAENWGRLSLMICLGFHARGRSAQSRWKRHRPQLSEKSQETDESVWYNDPLH